MTRVTLTYGDIITDLRTSDALSVEGVETFARVAYDVHIRAIMLAEQLTVPL